MKKLALLMVSAVILAAPAGASAAASKPAPPCSAPVFRQFDFWLGDWDVFDPAGALVGQNSITREEQGCLLVEHWTSASGGTGQSFNFVDLETGKWRQVWVSIGATIDYSGGLNAQGEMVLEGRIGHGPGKPNNGAKFRGTWTANADGSVTQYFQQYDDKTGAWADWFKGTYRRKAAQ